MGVYQLKSTAIMSDESVAVSHENTADRGRNWGRMLLWVGIALVIAGAMTGGGWLAYRAGQQAGTDGSATAAAGAAAGAMPFAPGGAPPANGTRGAAPGAATENGAAVAPGSALAATNAVTESIPAAPPAGAPAIATDTATGGTAPAASAAGTAPAASAVGLGAISATAQAAPVTINTEVNALEQTTPRAAATSSGTDVTASIPAIVAAANTPILSDAGAALATLDSGDSLRATARSSDSQWLTVQSARASGWVRRSAVIAYGIGDLATATLPDAVRNAATSTTMTQTSAAAQAGTMTLVTTGPAAADTTAAAVAAPARTASAGVMASVITSAANLNVRAGPGTAYAIVAKAAAGSTVTPVARNDAADWLKVDLPTGASGWAAARYLNVTGDAQTLPLEEAPDLPAAAAPTVASTTNTTATAEVAAAASLSGTLAFQQSPGGMIWTYDFATGATKSLTNGFDPAISPDGSTVAFVREGGEAGLYLIGSDGSNERLIFAERGRLSAPKWSGDGAWILFGRGDEYYECYPMGQNECLTEDELAQRFPKGAPPNLVLERRYFDKLSVVDANGNNFHDIPSLTSAKAADWDTGSANAEIVYQSSAGLRRTADGLADADQLLIFEPLQQQFQDPDWQPGSTQIIYQKKGATQWDIWAVNADGANVHGLTQAATTLVDKLPSNVSPAWSPDGAHIVYLSNRAENNEAGAWRLWVMDADGGNAHALAIDVPLTYTFGAEQVVSWGGSADQEG